MAETQQKALLIEKKMGPFILSTRPIPTPGAGNLLVKVHAVGLNPVDWKIQAYGLFVEDYPAVVGTDIAGEVESVGEGVEGFKKGDRVFFQGPYNDGRYGGFQQYTVIAAEFAGKIPANITYSQAATIPVGFNCAVISLFAPKPIGVGLVAPFDRKPHCTGQAALVIGGSASVGQYAIQLLKLSGFSPIVAYASARHATYLTSLGATHVIDRAVTPLTAPALHAAFQDLTSTPAEGIQIAFDAVCSAEAQQVGYDLMAPGGTLITLLPSNVKETTTEQKHVLAVLGSVHPPNAPAFGRLIWKNLSGLVGDGLIVPNRLEELPGGLGGILSGLERMQRDEVSGIKLVGHPFET
ncbi:chaperonin 10-like protein [Mycena vulgaris]|nr:chaperonin 10-like protein [Mycena vulgaris]